MVSRILNFPDNRFASWVGESVMKQQSAFEITLFTNPRGHRFLRHGLVYGERVRKNFKDARRGQSRSAGAGNPLD